MNGYKITTRHNVNTFIISKLSTEFINYVQSNCVTWLIYRDLKYIYHLQK